MALTFDQICAEALALPMEERSWLADALWESLRTPEEREIDAAWVAEAECRIAEVEAGTAKTIPVEEALRNARRRLEDLKSGRDIGLTLDEFFADEGSEG